MASSRRVVVLVRHAEALAREADPERPLSARGRRQAERSGRWAARRGIRITHVWHSGKRRAAETAAIITACLGSPASTEQVDGLSPNDDPLAFASRLGRCTGGVMVVGHLPFLERLTGVLTAGDPARRVVRFGPACLAVLEADESGEGWSIVAVEQP